MNELDLVELLKDCPKGTKFYSTVFGDVYFEKIDLTNDYFPIKLTHSDGRLCSVTNKGLLFAEFNGECTLFPDINQRDWSKWHLPFVDGDVVTYNNQIAIFKKYISEDSGLAECYVFLDIALDIDAEGGKYYVKDFATEDERKKLFDTLKSKGCKWNPETKTLENLIEPKFKVGDRIRWKNNANSKIDIVTKLEEDRYILDNGNYITFGNECLYNVILRFDPSTLIPFDRVLVRNEPDEYWRTAHFSHIEERIAFKFIAGHYWRYCIPYNEETKHLTGTVEDAPGFYRYWED